MFEFKSKKRIRIEQELEAAKRQIEEEKKKAQAIHEESEKLKELLTKQQRDLEHLLNVIKLEQYRQEYELRKELDELEQVSEAEKIELFQRIKERFKWNRTEARTAVKEYENQYHKRTTVEKGMSLER